MSSIQPKVLIVGASAGTGREAVRAFAAAGYQVTAMARSINNEDTPPGVTHLVGDATQAEDVDRAVQGQDAVVITLGLTTNPLKVRLFGSPALHVRSEGTRQVIAAMQRHGVRRLVTLSTYGIGDTRRGLATVDRIFFDLVLKPQIADHEVQEEQVRSSGLDWVIARPVHLNDEPVAEPPFLHTQSFAHRHVSRTQVAGFLLNAVQTPNYLEQAIAVSAA